jgi:hypothetical protein
MSASGSSMPIRRAMRVDLVGHHLAMEVSCWRGHHDPSRLSVPHTLNRKAFRGRFLGMTE